MAAKVKVAHLTFEHHPTGLGVPVSEPRLSWAVASTTDDIPRNWVQKSYEIQIRRASDQSVQTFHSDGSSTVLVPWPAAALRSAEFASVRVRSHGASDAGELSTDWSNWATVEAALLDASDWMAKTITAPERRDETHPDENGTRPLRLRKTFTAFDKPARSRLYISALGIYEAYLNGQRIGDECLAPGWTSYQHRIQFQVFDVAALLRPGSNTLVVEIAEGWYVGRLLWGEGVKNFYGNHTGLLAQLDVFDSADSLTPSLRVTTEESWECRISPIVASGIYDGETYDLSLEYDSFDTSSSASWLPVRVIDMPKAMLVASSAPPIRVTQIVRPVAILKDPDGKALVDFGQNLVGRIRIPHLAKPDGHRVVIRFAEVLEHERLGTRPLREAKATDTIIFGGGRPLQDWAAHFTYHGFRYIELTGWNTDHSDPLTLDSLVAEVIHTDMNRTGYFSCSDEKVNQLHKNVVWSMRGNFVGLPTDCPQRDERLGWTGDIQVFTPTASYLYSCAGILISWMRDLIADQKENNGIVPIVVPNALKAMPWTVSPQAVWDDAVILVPWALYRTFGDIQVLTDSWDGMKLYLETLQRGEDGLWDPSLWQLGDWLDPNAPPDNPGLARTDGTLVADEYLIHVTSVAGKIAKILGHSDDVERFQSDYSRLKQVFEDKYMAKSGLIVGDSQTSLALSLAFHLHSDAKQRKVAADRLARLVRYAKFKVSTGFAGTPVILDALTKGGHANIAYRMLLEEECPSWLYPVSKGATTIWERWDSMLSDGSINPGQMTSFNHYALGSVASWLHETVAGLSPLEPGWKSFLVKPVPGGTITSADTIFQSPHGLIRSSWKLDEDRTISIHLTVPPNTNAQVVKPDGHVDNVGSGEHVFECKVPPSEEPWPPKPIVPE